MRLGAEASRRHQKARRWLGDITGGRGAPGAGGRAARRGSVNVMISIGATLGNPHVCALPSGNNPGGSGSKALRLPPFVCSSAPVIPNAAFLVNGMMAAKTFLINCHNYCDHFCPNEQPDGRIWCHICVPLVLIWRRVHLSTLCCLLRSQSVLESSRLFQGCEFSSDYISLLNIKVEGVWKQGIYLHD